MPRLFITPREIDFINDISKEVIKDIIGQKVYYYPISFDKSKVDDVYEEAIEKIFENPIEINCIVDWQPPDITTTKFGQDSILSIKVYIQSRDLIHKEIEVKDGDFFSYGSEFFEITSARTMKNIYGQVEYGDGIELLGRQARKDLFSEKAFGPTKESFNDPEAVQKTFVQQRGFDENREGKTGDKRDLVDNGVLDAPDIDEPAEISSRGTSGNSGNAFFGQYDDEDL